LLDRERHRLDGLRSRPVLARPESMLADRGEQVRALRQRAARVFGHRLERAASEVHLTLARLRAISPKATLERGYAVVQRRSDGAVLRDPAQVHQDDEVRVRLAYGELAARVTSS
ncbi:MAG TPA: exodeoxyribonuclease VII large subunit, partial [Micromonosporaceae bacterium]